MGKPFHPIPWKFQPLIKQNTKTKVVIMWLMLTWMVQIFKLYRIPCFLNMDNLVSGIIAVWIVISLFHLNWVFEEMLVDLWVCCSYLPRKYYIQIQQRLFPICVIYKIITIQQYPWRLSNWQNPSKGYFILCCVFFCCCSCFQFVSNWINN